MLAAVVSCSSGSGSPDGGDGVPPSTVPSQAIPTKVQHPLDGLTVTELETFRNVLQDKDLLLGSEFPYLALDEPAKADVLAWRKGSPMRRRAFAVVRRNHHTYEAVVDLGGHSLVSWTERPGANTGFATSEFGVGSRAASRDQRMIDALAKRSLTVQQVSLVTFAGGSTNAPGEAGRRIARVVPYLAAGDPASLLSRPVEGLFASVDVDTGEVISVTDSGATRVPPAPVAPRRERPPLTPVVFASEGSNVRADGTQLSWSGWSMHWRANRRSGVEIADARFDAGDGARRVLYEASVADLFVPYQHPDPSWAFRTLLDSAEFGMGNTMSPLQPGVDCPTTASFFDVMLPDDAARAVTKPRSMCVFERPTGTPAYRHEGDAAPETELVLRWIAVVGNYDYIIDNVFGADGSLRFHVFAAGIALQRGTSSSTADEAHTVGEDQHGVLVGDGLLAVNHDHYVSFRLDLDVGDTDNRIVRQALVPERVSGNAGRRDIWRVDEQVIAREVAARYTPDARSPERVLVQSASANGPLGHHPGYEIDFGDGVAVAPAAAADDPGSRRGGWAAETLWVTPNEHDERFASGLYIPDGSEPVGLPVWTAQDRSISGTDLVVWFTVGFHHVVRTEDLPSMPAHEGGFGLRPADIYPSNPLLG
jgi:primary-amine oxidase